MTTDQLDSIRHDLKVAQTNVDRLNIVQPNSLVYSYWLGRLDALMLVLNTLNPKG